QQGPAGEHRRLAGPGAAGDLASSPSPGARRASVLRLERAGRPALLGDRRPGAHALRCDRARAGRPAPMGLGRGRELAAGPSPVRPARAPGRRVLALRTAPGRAAPGPTRARALPGAPAGAAARGPVAA